MLACSVFHGILLSRSVGLNKCEGRGQAGVDLQQTHIFAATISASIALKGIPSWQLSLKYRSGKSLNPTQCQQYSREISNTQPLLPKRGAACCLFLSNIYRIPWKTEQANIFSLSIRASRSNAALYHRSKDWKKRYIRERKPRFYT